MKKQKFIKPDYAAGNMFGACGSIEDAPHPVQRYWPGAPKKRRVDVTIMTYDFGGHHYFVSIQEEENPVWDGIEHWASYPDDVECRGRDHHDFTDDIRDIPYIDFPFHYSDYHSARLCATTILDKHFNIDEYEIEWHDYAGEDVDGWCYVGKHGE